MATPQVLLIDDEAGLLGLLKRHLERAGFGVVACVSAELALERLEGTDWRPELLITDETLPGQSGSTLAGILLRRFPEMVCLLCSGYPLSLDGLPAEVRPRAAILQKPFTPILLERAVGEMLMMSPKDRADA